MLEPHGEPLLDGDEMDSDDEEAAVDPPAQPNPISPQTVCQSVEVYMNGVRVQYKGKEAHIMTIVNAKFNKKRVRRASDRLLKIEGVTAQPTPEVAYTVTPLGEMLWVGAPFIALINFQEGKRKTALKSTCWVFAVLEGKLHGSIPNVVRTGHGGCHWKP